MTGPGPAPGIKFIYVPAVDLSAIRRFYGTLLGLAEIYYSASEGHLAYDCAGLQVSFFHDSAAELAGPGWARQPGWSGGTRPSMSWSVVLGRRQFVDAVEALS
ncbi:MAG: hypothetical protein OEO77_05310, partial [Acidimicrobiia bacterium]|nr:hypothetical protein [Acidimicrobiia bacterium]